MSLATARDKRAAFGMGSSSARLPLEAALGASDPARAGVSPAGAQADELRALLGAAPVQQEQGKEAPGSLPGSLRGRMERMFGADFSGVRVFEDGQAPAGVNAYAQGDRIHFAPGRYSPDTVQGRALLGHELAHVMQQRAGRVAAGTDAWGGLRVNQEPHLEHEADRWGERAAGLGFAGGWAQAAQGGGGGATAQLNGGFATVEEAIDNLSDQSKKHIMVPKHRWDLVLDGFTSPESEKQEAVIPPGSWEAVSGIMKEVVKSGSETAYGKSATQKQAPVKDQTVTVVYIKFKDGTFRVSDAWVNTR